MTIRMGLSLAALLWAGAAAAQETRTQRVERFEMHTQTFTGNPAAGEGLTFQYISTEMGLPGKVVKGAPYAADTVTETTQTLADGNRIRHQTASKIWRDSEGRTRRQLSFGNIGGVPAGERLPELTTIADPVAGVQYMLNAQERTAQKSPLPTPGEAKAMALPGGSFNVMIRRESSGSGQNSKKESLGRQMVEGVAADGTRLTVTIPAGEMGNERPLEIVTENWHSPELQTMVMTRHSDPRSGETVYRLTNIDRSEPARSLFEIPADYSVSERKGVLIQDKRVVIQK